MTAIEAMHTIDGRRFAALTNLASHLKTFLRIASQQAEVDALARAMTNDPTVIAEVAHRATALATSPSDAEREHGGDSALATYLWLLSSHDQELATTAAVDVRTGGKFFWARKVADTLRTTDGDVNGQRNGADGATTSEAAGDVQSFQGKP